MRAAVRDLLLATPSLTAVVPADRWYEAGAVIDTPVKPFVVLRWLAPVPLAGRTFGRQLRIDIHDERGNYNRIYEVIGELFIVLSAVVQHVGVDGRIAQCDYLGNGGDQEDPEYGTNFSFSSWQMIGVNL